MAVNPTSPVVPSSYPATLSVDYPDRKLNRLTSFFRIFVAIPIIIVLTLITGGHQGWDQANKEFWRFVPAAGGIVFIPTLLLILFRKKYPRWWFDWNLGLYQFSTRVSSYMALLRDEYPSTDEEQAVHVDFAYPDVERLGRGMPLIKWFLAIPHFVILIFLGIAAVVCVIIAWFAILFTGRYPRGLFDFVVGVGRWALRSKRMPFCLLLICIRHSRCHPKIGPGENPSGNRSKEGSNSLFYFS
jgi:hypothetical protein